LKEASSLAVIVAPLVGLGLMTGGCGIGLPRCCKAPAVFAIPPRTPGSVCASAGTHDRHSRTAVEIAKVRKFLMDMLPFPHKPVTPIQVLDRGQTDFPLRYRF
jgi:hypothetical protein